MTNTGGGLGPKKATNGAVAKLDAFYQRTGQLAVLACRVVWYIVNMMVFTIPAGLGWYAWMGWPDPRLEPITIPIVVAWGLLVWVLAILSLVLVAGAIYVVFFFSPHLVATKLDARRIRREREDEFLV